jgi:hypothetical protein
LLLFNIIHKYLNNFYNFKIFIELFLILNQFTLFLCYQTKPIKIGHTVG